MLFAILFALPFFQNNAYSAYEPAPTSTWIWHTNEIVDDSAGVLDFLESKNVSIVYLQVNPDIANKHYANFIRQATQKDIQVQALGGSSSWISTRGELRKNVFFQWVAQYEAQAKDDEHFSAIHLDVEPYLASSWKSNYDAAVFSYQQLLFEAKKVATDLQLSFEIDIPFWFDKRYYANSFGEGTLSEWLIDLADCVTIMAYRDTAKGRNGMIELARSEMEYAEEVGKRVSVGVETERSSEGDFLSFFEEGEAYMNEQLILVEKEFFTLDSFRGFSIHSMHSWKKLK